MPGAELLNGHTLGFVEDLYEEYLRDPALVGGDWREYFDEVSRGDGGSPRPPRGPGFARRSVFNPAGGSADQDLAPLEMAALQDRVDQLLRSYRVRGHVIAQLDPLGPPPALHPELDYEYYGLRDEDLDRVFSCRTISGADFMTLREILAHLQKTYCSCIGAQYMHIDSVEIKMWLQTRMEDTLNRVSLGREEQLRILTRLTDAEIFETFVQKKFPAAKRFSLEGAESLVPLLDLALEEAGAQGIEEVIIGMAHRGRLNVLANIAGKDASLIFREFEDADPERHFGRGDVKYHLGHKGVWTTGQGRSIDISLTFNPSHLEFVNPVVLGRVRARQDRLEGDARGRVLPLLIHGDAAFAGEGIVQETLNLSELEGYATGGCLHVVVNNQLGFTTPPDRQRSSQYATDVARMLQIPIFHVNGEQPEAVAQVIKLAMDFRAQFHRDVVVDMYCYRRHGHNEGDEPSFTQPRVYKDMRNRPTVRENYVQNLLKLGKVTAEEAEGIARERRAHLEEELSRARSADYDYRVQYARGAWTGYRGGADREVPEVPTSMPAERLSELLLSALRLPEGFALHPKLHRLWESRQAMARGEASLDWGAGEWLAMATLAAEGYRVRLSGQDVGRGTFSHRHALVYDYETGRRHRPLCHVVEGQGPVDIYDSPLSEAGVLGFDYGYSLESPDALVIWEAQFGDFVNVAQPIIDQFLSSSEDKWQRLSGLVLLLPHGFEGQGPEHSSARLERFLTLAAEDNMQIVNPTTPAQLFHCLRRQVLRPLRKPLVVMSPKSLLRHPEATSPLADFAEGHFQRVIPDLSVGDPDRVRRVLLCSGKIYYDLQKARSEREMDDVAVVRLEQLYPLDEELLRRALALYAERAPVVWVQEEPENMGALVYLKHHLGDRLFGRRPFHTVSRHESASPATGSARSHKVEQEWLISQAFDLA